MAPVSNGLNFYALVSGPVPSPFRNRRGRRSLLDVLLRRRRDSGLPLDMVPLSVVDLEVLHVPSGRLEACDPFVTLGRDIARRSTVFNSFNSKLRDTRFGVYHA